MQTAHLTANPNHKHYALITASVTVEKEIPLIVNDAKTIATLEKDYNIGIYGFTSQEKRDKFKSMINTSDSENKPCVAVLLQNL